jgi:two-component system alkaline phosphatase synthesis response regulator PhoP
MIFYVEDDENIRNMTVFALVRSGLEVVGFASSYELYEAIERALGHSGTKIDGEERPVLRLPDLILLDIMLPGEDGITTLKNLRARSETSDIPVMLITAKSSEYDVANGLDSGADDYLTKPFGTMELVARVNALLRRTAAHAAAIAEARADAASTATPDARSADADDGMSDNTNANAPLGRAQGADVLRIGEVTLSASRHRVTVGGRYVSLTLKEFELLRYLMENPGIVLSRERILETVWGWHFDGATRTVDVHVQTLRQKLGPGSWVVETVRGVGYRARDGQ